MCILISHAFCSCNYANLKTSQKNTVNEQFFFSFFTLRLPIGSEARPIIISQLWPLAVGFLLKCCGSHIEQNQTFLLWNQFTATSSSISHCGGMVPRFSSLSLGFTSFSELFMGTLQLSFE